MTNKRNGSIDFWRFVFATLLVIFHAYLLNEEKRFEYPFILGRGAIAVEFFLLTSGYLLASSVHRVPDSVPFDWHDTWGFIKRKIMGFYPAFLIAWFITFVTVNIVKFENVSTLLSNLFSSIFEVTLIRNAGFTGYRSLPQAWYLSAMILSLFILYPIYRRNKKRFEYYIAPAIAILVLGYLFYNTKSLINPNKYLHYGLKSTFRAFAEICLGVVCYVLCEKLKTAKITRTKAHLLSVAELFGYGASIYYMQCFDLYPEYFDYVALFLMMFSIIISFSGLSSVHSLFENDVFRWLGKFSLYPYLMFMVFTKTLPILFPHMDLLLMELLYIGLTFLSALLVMWIEQPIVRLCGRTRRLVTRKE